MRDELALLGRPLSVRDATSRGETSGRRHFGLFVDRNMHHKVLKTDGASIAKLCQSGLSDQVSDQDRYKTL